MTTTIKTDYEKKKTFVTFILDMESDNYNEDFKEVISFMNNGGKK